MKNLRQRKSFVFKVLCNVMTLICLFFLVILLFHLVQKGFKWLSWDFLTQFPSRVPSRAGLKSALYGTLWLMGLTALISIPLGLSTAIFLEEYVDPKRKWAMLLKVNIANLAGIPSVVYGLLGLTLFVRFFCI